MIYLSRGIPLWRPAGESVSVSHCGSLFKLDGTQGKLWLAGQYRPAVTQDHDLDADLVLLAGLGIVVACDDSDDAAVFRLLVNCTICPAHIGRGFAPLTRMERRFLRWIRHAGLRLTMAELTLLTERDVRPVSALLGEKNRQALTEAIYTVETICDGILEATMENSSAREASVHAVLGLLRKRKIFLV